MNPPSNMPREQWAGVQLFARRAFDQGIGYAEATHFAKSVVAKADAETMEYLLAELFRQMNWLGREALRQACPHACGR